MNCVLWLILLCEGQLAKMNRGCWKGVSENKLHRDRLSNPRSLEVNPQERLIASRWTQIPPKDINAL